MSENPGATRTDQRGDRSNRRRANRGQSGQAIEAPCLADQLGAHIRQYGRSTEGVHERTSQGILVA
jgi:hypothetical protein